MAPSGAPLALSLLAPLLATVISSLAPTPAAAADRDALPVAKSSSSGGGIPDLESLETVYSSTQSVAGCMFDVKSKSSIAIYGLDANVYGQSAMRVRVYTKEGSYEGSEYDKEDWELWMDATIESEGLDRATHIPQDPDDAVDHEPLLMPARSRRAFYVAFDGPYLRYSDDQDKMYYINHDALIYGQGAAKRKGWGGGVSSPRTFNGALRYYRYDKVASRPSLVADATDPTPGVANSQLISKSITLHPIADTWLEYNDTRAFGTMKRLKVDGNPTRVTLLKFDMSELTGKITSVQNDIVDVRLRLYSQTSSPFGGKVDLLNQNCNGWDEKRVTYVNAPICAFRSRTRFYAGRFEGEVSSNSWNEATLILGLADDTLPELITLRVTSHHANGTTYSSRDADTNRPELVVSYVAPDDDINVIQAKINTEGDEQVVPATTSATKAPPKIPGACSNRPFADRAELKYAVDVCFYGGYGDRKCHTDTRVDDNECDRIKKRYGWPMNAWCVGDVTDMHFLFVEKRDFDEDISDWDVSNVIDFYETFSYASSFNGDLSKWDFSKVIKTYGMFNGAKSFTGESISEWDTSSLEDMQWMFYEATSFNADLSNWDVSSVTNMWEAFMLASAFTSDLSRWDTSSVEYMEGLFHGATAFNSDLSKWDTSKVWSMKVSMIRTF